MNTLKIITQEELNKKLEKHRIWLDDSHQDGAEKLDLSNHLLENLYFDYKNLSYVNFENSILRNISFYKCQLRYTKLNSIKAENIKIFNCDLSNSKINNSIFAYCDMSYSDFINSQISYTNFEFCNLGYSDFGFVTGEKLNIEHSSLYSMDLSHHCIKNLVISRCPEAKLVCPEEGSFIGFKKCKMDKIVKLIIPEDASRSSATSRKCRTNKAVVLEISSIDGETKYKEAYSLYDQKFVYKVGEMVEEKHFNHNRWNECAEGIHFFMTREEAVEY